MRQPFRSHLFLLIALVLLALPAPRAAAHDEGGGITLRAPLDAVDCTATLPTITVLGLTIDISTATIDAHGEGDDGGDQDFVVHASLTEDSGGDVTAAAVTVSTTAATRATQYGRTCAISLPGNAST